MIRTKGEAGTGDIVNAVRHMRAVFGGIRRLQSLAEDELFTEAKELAGARTSYVKWVAEHGRLPVVTFTAGGIATPADAALCMQLGADGVFVGSGIFKSEDPMSRAKAIVEATTHFNDPEILARVSTGLGEAMRGSRAAGARARRAARDRAAGSPRRPARFARPARRFCRVRSKRGRGAEGPGGKVGKRVDEHLRIGVLAVQGTSASTRLSCAGSAPTRSRCGRRSSSTASTA